MSTTTDATMAEQLREWALELESFVPRDPETRAKFTGILAGMRQVARDKAPKTRIRRRITIVRHWFDDSAWVQLDLARNPAEAWMKQVETEFNEVGMTAAGEEGTSVISLDDKAVMTHYGSGDLSMQVNAWLDFLCDPDEYAGEVTYTFEDDKEADLIQHIFYATGGVAGEFHMLDDGGEK